MMSASRDVTPPRSLRVRSVPTGSRFASSDRRSFLGDSGSCCIRRRFDSSDGWLFTDTDSDVSSLCSMWRFRFRESSDSSSMPTASSRKSSGGMGSHPSSPKSRLFMVRLFGVARHSGEERPIAPDRRSRAGTASPRNRAALSRAIARIASRASRSSCADSLENTCRPPPRDEPRFTILFDERNPRERSKSMWFSGRHCSQ